MRVEFRGGYQKLTSYFYVQVRYAATEIHPTKSARSRGAYLRVSFKNTRETAQAINGWKLERAVKFLENVKEKKEAVAFRRYAGGIGRAAQGTLEAILAEALQRLTLKDRKAIRCLPCSLANQVCRVLARSSQERGGKRRYQGS